MKKTIGIYADTFNGKVGQTFSYMQFFSQFGYVRLISTSDNLENIVNEVDMLVMPGGADVDVSTYNATPGVMDGRANQHYEYLDKTLIPQFIEARKPIFGICRGAQRLNTWFNGTLNQHILGHHQGDNREATRQEMQFPGITDRYYINTMHHQSVDILGENLELTCYSQRARNCYSSERNVQEWRTYNDKTGSVVSNGEQFPIIIEGFQHTELPIVGLQYHPEEMNCEYAKMLITKLLTDD
jgi:gamma-glutamyl-gamma-aminobutyrate hydrolase PuuD